MKTWSRTLALLFTLALLAVPALAADVPADASTRDAVAPTVQPEVALDDLFAPEATPVNDCKGGTGGRCICPELYAPVCGCDGVTYVNSCYASCKVKSWTTGSCDGGVIL